MPAACSNKSLTVLNGRMAHSIPEPLFSFTFVFTMPPGPK